MCRTSRTIFSAARLPTCREELMSIPRFTSEMVTVTGFADPRSITRASVHLSSSNSNGGRAYQPWLITARRKLKLLGVEIVIFMANPRLRTVPKERDDCKSGDAEYAGRTSTPTGLPRWGPRLPALTEAVAVNTGGVLPFAHPF